MEDQTPANLENGNDEVDIKTEPITEEIKENEKTGQKEGAPHAKKEERVNDDVNKESDVVAAAPKIDNKSDKTHQNNKNKATKQDTKHEKGFRRDSKVHPADGHVAPHIQTNESTEKTKTVEPPKKEIIMELDPEKKRVLGIKLLNLISHKGKKEDILVLIQGGAQVDMKNEAGWQPMHFAAAAGSVAIINALIENKAKPNCYDNNFQTPLHVAARRGQVASVIALVAHGTQVETRDWEGNAPLELAVTGRHVRVVETLFLFGAEPNLNDWSWTMKDENKFTKDELAILTLFGNQLPKVPGYKYGGISKDVGYLKPGKSHNFEECCANMLVEQAKTPFFAFCCKMQSEYADLKSYLKEDQSPFSDMYECRYWGLSNKTATFTLTIEGQPSANEITDFVSPQGKIGRVDNIEKKEEENQTIVTITLKLAKEATRFALALRREPEKFQITKEAVTIQPKNEPDAAIDIPEGTFDKAAELQLNVVETKDVNEDEESGPILMTNVIDMSMSDGQQPNKGIDMKLPIHSKDQNDVLDLCVLATSEEEPDDIDDWEIIEAKPDKSGKAAVFKIEHFSIYTVISRSVDKDKAVAATMRSVKKLRKVLFFVIMKWIEKDCIEVVVECVRKKTLKQRQRHWEEEEYDIENSAVSDQVEVLDGEFFRLRMEGNIKEKSGKDAMTLTFQKSRDNYHAMLCSVTEEAEHYRAKLCIERGRREIEEVEMETTTERVCKCFSKKVLIKQTVIRELYSPFLDLPIAVKDTNKGMEAELHKLYERQITTIPDAKGSLHEESSEPVLEEDDNETTADLQLEIPDEEASGSEPKIEVDLLADIKDSESLHSDKSETENDQDSVTSALEAETEARIEQQIEEMEKRMYNIPANVKLAKPVLFPSSISNLTKKLTNTEKELLAIQLGFDIQRSHPIRTSQNPSRELEHAMISNYRGTGTSVVKVRKLIKALKQINREDLATQVQYCMDNDIPIPP